MIFSDFIDFGVPIEVFIGSLWFYRDFGGSGGNIFALFGSKRAKI